MRSNVCSSSCVPSTAVLRFLRQQTRCMVRESIACSKPSCLSPPATRSFSSQCQAVQSRRVAPLVGSGQVRPTFSPHIASHVHVSARLNPSWSPSNQAATRSMALVGQKPPYSWGRAWKSGPKDRPENSFTPNDSPLGDHGELGLAYRGAKKGPNDVLRCTELNENGEVVFTNSKFKKIALIAKYGLQPRDLRKVDSGLLPVVLIRQSAILVNLLHLRVLIQYNRILIFDTYGSTDSFAQSAFMYDLEGRLQNKDGRHANGLPYEFRALEAVLISVTTALEAEFEYVQGPVLAVLRALEEDIDRDKLRELLILSKKLGTFEQKATLVRDALDELLEEDADLADMYLTEKHLGKMRADDDDHQEVEMLLESYHKLCDETVQASSNLVKNIKNTEEIIRAILDANRNSLMLLDLKFSIGALSLGFGTFLAALFGMNLKSFLEEAPLGFYSVTSISFVLTGIAAIVGFKKLRRVQRIKMRGEGGWNGEIRRPREVGKKRSAANASGDGGHPPIAA